MYKNKIKNKQKVKINSTLNNKKRNSVFRKLRKKPMFLKTKIVESIIKLKILPDCKTSEVYRP